MFDLSAYNEKSTLPILWDCFYKVVYHDKTFLHYHDNQNIKVLTYKELNAKAHCFAAYMMSLGINTTDKVLILSKRHPNFYIVDLACHFLGIPNLVLPDDIEKDKLKDILKNYQPLLCYIEDYDLFKNFQEDLQLYSKFITLQEENPNNILESEKIVMIDRAIEIGKIFWRENQTVLSEQKNSFSENQILFYISTQNFITHKDFISNLKKLLPLFKTDDKAKEIKVYIQSLPFHLLHRYLFYLSLFQHFTVFINNHKEIPQKFIKKYQIHYWVTSGNIFHSMSKEWFMQRKWLSKIAIEKQKKVFQKKIQNKTLSFGLKIQSNLLGLQRNIIKKKWGKLKSIHVLENELQLEDLLHWNSLHVPIYTYQINENSQILSQNIFQLKKMIALPKQNLNLFHENFYK